ncbi:MAG: hypothetical protein R3B96_20860 [Pirellulaceae bacterium]
MMRRASWEVTEASNSDGPVQRSRSTWVGQTEVGASGEKFAWTQIGGMGMGGMSGGMVDVWSGHFATANADRRVDHGD